MRLKLKGDRPFSVAAPQLWNNLPLYLRSATSLQVFKSSVKTYLFKKAYGPYGPGVIVVYSFIVCIFSVVYYLSFLLSF